MKTDIKPFSEMTDVELLPHVFAAVLAECETIHAVFTGRKQLWESGKIPEEWAGALIMGAKQAFSSVGAVVDNMDLDVEDESDAWIGELSEELERRGV